MDIGSYYEEIRQLLTAEIKKLANKPYGLRFNSYDEVFENCYLGDS